MYLSQLKCLLILLKSPTASIPEPYPAQNGGYSVGYSGSRGSPLDRITLLVTTDAEHLVTVDVTGANDAAFIRERIFTKVCDLFPFSTKGTIATYQS
jgi:hypothetical protein